MKKLKWNFRKNFKYVFFGGIFVGVVFFSINFYVVFGTDQYIFEELEDLPEKEVVLVLGAAVLPNGNLSDALSDRMIKALELYNKGKVEKFLLSGDNGTEEYNEVGAMKDFLLNNGVNGEDIFMDHAGFDTYDSIYRAADIFGVEEAIIVTQAFHLPRAVYIARKKGIDAYGYPADRQKYRAIIYYELREMIARSKSFFDVLFNSDPKFFGEKVSLDESGELTWD